MDNGKVIYIATNIFTICMLLVNSLFMIPSIICCVLLFRTNHPKKISTIVICSICVVLTLIVQLFLLPTAESLAN